MMTEEKHLNGAGSHPHITHPVSTASGNSAPVQVTQVTVPSGAVERAANIMHRSGVLSGIAIATALGAFVFAWVNHNSDVEAIRTASEAQVQALRSAADTHAAAIREYSDWSAKIYNRAVAIDADAGLLGRNYRERFGPIPVPPAAAKKEK